MRKMVLASSNEGKIKEIKQLLSPYNIKLLAQSEWGIADADEVGLTFIENALIKARQAAALTKWPAIADDSGLVVPALKGEPGIYSARYAGQAANQHENIQKLLNQLKGVPDEERKAYFYCVMVMLEHALDPCPIVCEGIWHGKIIDGCQGDQGFGYDPVFYELNYRCSAAELSPEVKNSISHRGQAVRQLLQRMKSRY